MCLTSILTVMLRYKEVVNMAHAEKACAFTKVVSTYGHMSSLRSGPCASAPSGIIDQSPVGSQAGRTEGGLSVALCKSLFGGRIRLPAGEMGGRGRLLPTNRSLCPIDSERWRAWKSGMAVSSVSWLVRLRGLLVPPWGLLTSAYLSFGALLAAISAAVTIHRPSWLPEAAGAKHLLVLAAAGLVIGIARSIPKSRVRLCIRQINTQVEVAFGDLFKQEGHKVVPVNEFFDTELGDCVSDRSVHGQFIIGVYKGDSNSLDQHLRSALANVTGEEVRRERGRTTKYPIGTTAVIGDLPGARYFLAALCHTDINTLKASADVPDLWLTLSGLWKSVREHANAYPVNIPLFGSGLAQIRLSPQQLLQVMLLSLVMEAKSREISTGVIRIVLHPSRFAEFDLESIRREWS